MSSPRLSECVKSIQNTNQKRTTKRWRTKERKNKRLKTKYIINKKKQKLLKCVFFLIFGFFWFVWMRVFLDFWVIDISSWLWLFGIPSHVAHATHGRQTPLPSLHCTLCVCISNYCYYIELLKRTLLLVLVLLHSSAPMSTRLHTGTSIDTDDGDGEEHISFNCFTCAQSACIALFLMVFQPNYIHTQDGRETERERYYTLLYGYDVYVLQFV